MEEALRIHSVVRILKKVDRSFCGMGFLVGEKYILTCMHVIYDSLGKDRSSKDLPEEDIHLDFPGLLPIHQTAIANIYRGYTCFCNDEKRDVAVLVVKDENTLIRKSSPLLSINSATNLSGISCSYFVCKNDTYYGWGEGVISESVMLGRIQVNQMVTGKGTLVALGFSGTPVWANHMNGIVGMIDQVMKDKGIATFIPNYVLMECLPPEIRMEVIPGYIQKLKAPKLPSDYIKRDILIEKIEALLYDSNFSEGNLIVFCGPHGSGKTYTALDIFYNYKQKKHWFDCKTIYQKSNLFEALLNIDENDLIIIDNLVMSHSLFKEGWLNEIKCTIIAITCDQAVAEELCLQFYKNKNHKKIVNTEGFNLVESNYYFRNCLSDELINETEIENLYNITNGIPLLMQFLKSIILEEKKSIEAENRLNLFRKPESFKKYLIKNQFSKTEVKSILVEKWLNQLSEPSKLVLGILSFIPIVGMNTSALQHTSKVDGEELQKAVTSLCDQGFVQLHFKGISHKDNLLIIHDLVKELIIENHNYPKV